MKLYWLFCSFILATTSPVSGAVDHSCGVGSRCTVVIWHESEGRAQIDNIDRASVRYSPFSTYKIPNTVIMLETGVVDSIDQPLDYSRDDYPPQDWWPDSWQRTPMTLAQALQRSAVPIYRTLSRKVGPACMQSWVDAFDYGNRDISSGVDGFWLNESLQISAQGQIQFLRRLFTEPALVSTAALDSLSRMMLIESEPGYQLYAKTGAGNMDQSQALGWYVGWLDNSNGRHYFAINVSADSFAEVQRERLLIANQYLDELKHAP